MAKTKSKPESVTTDRPRRPDQFLPVPFSSIAANRWNPRRRVDEQADNELTASIKEHGILEPMILRYRDADDVPLYEVVAGSRRFRCAQAAGLTSASCIVKDLTDVEAIEIALTENLNRRDMHPLDEAEAYAKLQRTDKRIYTIAGIAKRTGQTDAHVYRRLRLLDLDGDLQKAFADDRLSLGHAEKLVRLPPALRKEAADLKDGVVWSRSPLLDYDDKWIPSRDDLRPLADLEKFIRTRAHFDPADADARYFQPELIAQVADGVNLDGVSSDDVDGVVDRARASFVELSDDSFVRMRLKAKKGAAVPLPPSQWREVGKKRCDSTVRGVVTHGGPPRVLEVCTTRTCPTHWPAKKKTATSTKANKDKTADKPDWMLQQDRDAAERERWKKIEPDARQALLEYLERKPLKVTAELVRRAIGSSGAHILRSYGVKLTPATIAQSLALVAVGSTWSRAHFIASTKPFGFDLRPTEKAIAAEEKQKAAAEKKKQDAAIHDAHVKLGIPGKKKPRGKKGKAA